MDKSTEQLNRKGIIKEAFKKTVDSSPWVLKKLNSSFAVYYIPFAITFLFLAYTFWFPPSFALARYVMPSLLVMVGMAFASFLTPYYVRQYNEQGSTEPFKDFVRDNVTALVINHIKKFLSILLHSLLLIIPGIIKCIRLTFVTQTTFFDKNCKEGRLSALKASQDLTKGFLWPLCLALIAVFLGMTGISMLLKFTLKWILASSSNPVLSSITDGFGLTIDFYFHNLALIFMTQLYFSLKTARSEI